VPMKWKDDGGMRLFERDVHLLHVTLSDRRFLWISACRSGLFFVTGSNWHVQVDVGHLGCIPKNILWRSSADRIQVVFWFMTVVRPCWAFHLSQYTALDQE
jgi:hypothetical protein